MHLSRHLRCIELTLGEFVFIIFHIAFFKKESHLLLIKNLCSLTGCLLGTLKCQVCEILWETQGMMSLRRIQWLLLTTVAKIIMNCRLGRGSCAFFELFFQRRKSEASRTCIPGGFCARKLELLNGKGPSPIALLCLASPSNRFLNMGSFLCSKFIQHLSLLLFLKNNFISIEGHLSSFFRSHCLNDNIFLHVLIPPALLRYFSLICLFVLLAVLRFGCDQGGLWGWGGVYENNQADSTNWLKTTIPSSPSRQKNWERLITGMEQ